MNSSVIQERCETELRKLKETKTYKKIETLRAPQDAWSQMEGRGKVLVLSSNNYLGLANHPELICAAKQALTDFGAGTASVRFICGTMSIHHQLEQRTAEFLGVEATTTYASCWNANEAVFQTLFQEGDLVVSDSLNHASIIDGLRLMKKVEKQVYPHLDLGALEALLRSSSAKVKAIVTDGVFSMEGHIAPLPQLLQIARDHGAILIVDDSHATGVLGRTGKGTAEHFNLKNSDIDILTGTYGKALGGAAGGFIGGSRAIVDYCVQKSRPQLFSNALPPAVAATAIEALKILSCSSERVEKLRKNVQYFRTNIEATGLRPLKGETPIVPIIVGDTAKAIAMSQNLLERGVFVTGFGFPVVPQGEARLRIQISAAHETKDLDFAKEQIVEVAKAEGVLK